MSMPISETTTFATTSLTPGMVVSHSVLGVVLRESEPHRRADPLWERKRGPTLTRATFQREAGAPYHPAASTNGAESKPMCRAPRRNSSSVSRAKRKDRRKSSTL